MTIIVGETERAALKAAMARARTHPVSWEVLQRGIVDRSDAVRIEDRPATHKPRPLNSSICPSAMLSPSASKSTRPAVPARVGIGSVAEGGAEYGGLRDDL